jgi:hypothetical protein
LTGRTESFFHGTASNISDAVRPGVQVGRSIWGRTGASQGQASEEHAFATSDEDEAWEFAKVAHQIQHSKHEVLGDGPAPERARVYTVAPHPEMRPGVHHPIHPKHDESFGELHEYVAPEFKVTGRLDIAPGHQGTFPTINWRQFAHHDLSGDPNHPTPEEVAGGMRFLIGSPRGQQGVRERERMQVPPVPRRNVITPAQMDLFTGKTAMEHLDFRTDQALARYHARRLQPVLNEGERA